MLHQSTTYYNPRLQALVEHGLSPRHPLQLTAPYVARIVSSNFSIIAYHRASLTSLLRS